MDEQFYSAFSDDISPSWRRPLGLRDAHSPKWSSTRALRKITVMIALSVALFYTGLIGFQSSAILFVSITFTWFHIWLALRMCFYPIEFVGSTKGRVKIGWQGIVPGKADRMARASCDLMIDKLIFVDKVVDMIDAGELLTYLSRWSIPKQIESGVNHRIKSGYLRKLPGKLADYLLTMSAQLNHDVSQAFVDELKAFLRDRNCFDVRHLIIKEFTQNKRLLVNLFTQVGRQELEFIELAGGSMGLLCGLAQIAIYDSVFAAALQSPYLLFSMSGLVIGYLTNWIALFIIFNPVNPIVFSERRDSSSVYRACSYAVKRRHLACMRESSHQRS